MKDDVNNRFYFRSLFLDDGFYDVDFFISEVVLREVVENRDPKTVEESAKRLQCLIIVLDGTISVEEYLEIIMEHINI